MAIFLPVFSYSLINKIVRYNKLMINVFMFHGSNPIEYSILGNYFSCFLNTIICRRLLITAGFIYFFSFCIVSKSNAEVVIRNNHEKQDSTLMGDTNKNDSILNIPYIICEYDYSKQTVLSPVTDTIAVFNESIMKKEKIWNQYSFWATTIGALMTVFSIFVMYLIFRSDNKSAKEQLSLLKKQINNSDIQIRNQKNSLLTLTNNNLTVVNEMKKSVFTIQDHMVNKDVYLKLIEHKQAIKSSFAFLLKNHLMRQGFNLANGTVLQDEQVNNKVDAILEHIAIIDGLLNKTPTDYDEVKMLCENDMNSLSSRRSIHDDDVANWIKDVKKHFYSFDQMLGKVIKEVKTQNSFNGH